MKIEIDLTAPLFLLTALFAILKLAEIISWSWLWVLCPLWIPLMMILAFYALMLVLFIVAGLVKLVS